MLRIDVEGRGEEERQSFLSRDPAVEERVRTARVDAKAHKRFRRRIGLVDLWVDAVVNDMYAAGVGVGIAVDCVLAYRSRDGDHSVRPFDRGSLAEHR